MNNYTNIIASLNENTLVNTIQDVPNTIESSVDLFIKDNGFIDDFLQSNNGSEEELKFKQKFVRELVLARRTGKLPFNLPKDPLELASIVDEAANRIKTSHQVSVEELYPEEAVNELIDRGAARLCTVCDKLIDKHTDTVVKVGMDIITKIYPPAKVLEPYVQVIAHSSKPIIKATIHNGINQIANFSKCAIIKSAVKIGKTIQSKIHSFLHK